MEIHVVKPGETLWSIANQYGVSFDSVIQLNQLSSTDIVLNQSILVGTNYTSYVVMPGDTLRSVTKEYALSRNSILALNPQILGRSIIPGEVLRFPQVRKSKILSLGFLELTGTQADQTHVASNAPYNSYIAPFGYGMNPTGFITPLNDQIALQSIQGTRAVPAAVFSNWTGETFSATAVHALLSSPELRREYITEVLTIVKNKGYRAVVIDFESIAPGDSDEFHAFLAELSAALLPSYPLFVCVMPITGLKDASNPFLRPYAYATVAQHAVQLVLMAYNWHWATSAPGPIAAVQNVDSTIRYAISVMNRVQIILGVVRYGYDWKLPYQAGESATVVSSEQATQIAMENGSPILFDVTSMSPSFRYWDGEGTEHVVWFEDARSVQVKMQLVKRYRLPGLAPWELSQGFPQFVPLLLNNFQIW